MPSPASARPSAADLDGSLADRLAGDHLLEPVVAQGRAFLGELVAALLDAFGNDQTGDALRSLGLAEDLDPATGLGQGAGDRAGPTRADDGIDRDVQQLVAAIGQER